MKRLFFAGIIPLLSLLLACNGATEKPRANTGLTGPYLSQQLPGADPVIFAPGIVATGLVTRDMAITPDGKEIYFSRTAGSHTYATIMVTKLDNGVWTQPEVAPFAANPAWLTMEPCISSDGNSFYFFSNRPDSAAGETKPTDEDIWVMRRSGENWSAPVNMGPPVNSEFPEYFPSVTTSGAIYFTRESKDHRENYIYRCRFENGVYKEAEKLPPQINSTSTQFNAFIAPDESYLIVSVWGRSDSYGGADYYICFHRSDDTWSEPVNLGDRINSKSSQEYSPYISPDGRYFFFMSVSPVAQLAAPLTRDRLYQLHNSPQNGNPVMFWVDAGFIEQLRTANNE
ncbi:MAG TPA: hypothetical protein PLP19_11235 [bacterium]|nr:hypothetical protein [bacterium]HPN44055.1 hypothetical protein [bacterium]